jgi:hypothetical protein
VKASKRDQMYDVSAMNTMIAGDNTYIDQKQTMKNELKSIGKIGPVATFFAILKGYCAIVILIIPKAFQNGGYIFSPLCLLASCYLTTLCTLKLV